MQTNALSENLFETTLGAGVSKLWLEDAQILCYRFTAMTRISVDVTADDIRTELLQWDASRRWRVLLDIQKENVLVSAYALHRAREIARLRPELPGKAVVLTANVLTAQIASMAMRGLANEHRQRLVFSDEAKAVAWLLQDAKISF